jgi:hypothetical protein
VRSESNIKNHRVGAPSVALEMNIGGEVRGPPQI